MSEAMSALRIEARDEVWPLRQPFTISRGSKTAAHVVVATVSDGTHTGIGEAVPYARYGETVEGVLADIRAHAPAITSHGDLARRWPKGGAARNALDCAFWQLDARRAGRTVAQLAGLPEAWPILTAYTLSLDTPEAMAAAARATKLPLLKLKLGGEGDDLRMRAVRAARPDARLIVDANEAWTAALFVPLMAVAADCNVEVIEQPLPEGQDAVLRILPRPVPVCADESVHTAADIERLSGLYDAINIKLDKAGGLTGALVLKRTARAYDMKIMVGSMVGTSLGAAPALLLAHDADWADLDGPLLLARDREPGVRITDGIIAPLEPEVWG